MIGNTMRQHSESPIRIWVFTAQQKEVELFRGDVLVSQVTCGSIKATPQQLLLGAAK